MIVRADMGRGLAHQTKTFFDHLDPDVTVAVDMSLIDVKEKWPQDFDAYPGAIWSKWKGYTADFENTDALDALAECDVVYTAETYYDDRLPKLTNTVLHVNPEFFRHEPATRYWYPTIWRTKDLPPGELVPTPIPDERIATEIPTSTRLLHIAGHRAMGDRNGTQIVTGMLRRSKHEWRIGTQDGIRITPQVMAYTEVVGAVEDRWSLFDDCGILVYPRRYGGQSLQVNEAMARGLAVIMGEQSPNIETWPVIAVPTKKHAWVKTPAGRVQTEMPLVRGIQDSIDALLSDGEMLDRFKTRSLAWARDHSWSNQIGRIRKLLADAC